MYAKRNRRTRTRPKIFHVRNFHDVSRRSCTQNAIDVHALGHKFFMYIRNGDRVEFFSFRDTITIEYENALTMKGQNTCQWLVIGSVQRCGKSCLREYCRIHNARLAKGGGTTACTGCGKGVKNAFAQCRGCGYDRVRMRIWQRAHRSFSAEVQRLAAIEISN